MRDRFPALRLLERRRVRRTLRVVRQVTATDCGAACLTMVCRYWGTEVSTDAVRTRLGVSRNGVAVSNLIEVAHTIGFTARAVRANLLDLRTAERGTILHWKMNHFVVLDKATRLSVNILDPACGRRNVSWDDANVSFTGIMLTLKPQDLRKASARGSSRTRDYFGQVLQQRSVLGRVMVMSILAQSVGLTLPLLTRTIIDSVLPRGDLSLLTAVSIGGGVLCTHYMLTSYIRAELLLRLRTSLDVQMTLGFVEHITRLPLGFFHLRPTGDLLMRMNSNAAIREILTSGALSVTLDGLLLLSYLLALILANARLGCFVIGLGLLRVAVFAWSRRRFRDLTVAGLEQQALTTSYQVQILDGIEAIKATGTEKHVVAELSKLLVHAANISVRKARLSAAVDCVLSGLGHVSSILILCVGALLIVQQELSLGTVLAIMALAAGLLGSLSSLVMVALQFQTVSGLIERVDDVLAAPPEQLQVRPPAPALAGRLELRDVSFAYGVGSPLVADRVSLDVESGAHIGLVGRSGSGKSTIARLMAGVCRPTNGAVFLDGSAMSTYDLTSVRRQMGYVPQAPYLFGGSIRENITFGEPNLRDADVEWAANAASIHEEILGMPLGYNTPIVAGGGSLSGGQRQRIALARAFVRRPRILILDEATSHLDPIAESAIQQFLRSLRITVIVAAHRLSAIVDCDRIYVVEDGRLVESGTHRELIKRQARYCMLYRTQGTEESA